MIQNVRHVGLVVQDLEKQKLFYSAIGFRQFQSETESGRFIEQVTGIKKVKIEWVKMSIPKGMVLELLKYHQPESQIRDANAPADKLGCSHIAFTVNEIDEACNLIASNGGSVVNPPAQSPDGKVKVAYCYDPEGILLEIVEENPLVPRG